MPMERDRYPADWEDIATRVKEDADWRCEVCGKQCRRPGEPFDTHRRTLTVAHLDHTPENCARENLMAMCAPCHLRYDARQHAETRRRHRMKATDEDKHKAAEMLRKYGCDTLKDGSLLRTLKEVTGADSWRHVLLALADLIEPEGAGDGE